MKIKSRKKANIIALPEDFTSIKDINYDGDIKEITYQLEYRFKIIPALRNNVKDVKITILKKPPKGRSSAFGSRKTSGSRFKKQLQKSRKNARMMTMSKKSGTSTRIARMRSDISAYIDNRYAGKKITKQSLPMRKRIRGVRKSSLRQKQAVIKTFVGRQEKAHKIKKRPNRAARKMIYRGGLDPARIAGRRPPIVSAVENFQGTSRNLGKSSLNKSKRPSLVSKSDYYGYANSLNSVGRSTMSSDEFGEDAIVPMPVMERAETKKVTETIKFDEEQILGRYFWVKFDVFDVKGLKIQSIVRRVNHAEELGTAKMPTKRPIIKVSRLRDGINHIEISHKDKNATSVLLQYRELNPMKTMLESKYSTIGTFDCDSGIDGNIIKHTVGTNMPVHYRAVLTNARGDLSPVFSSEIFTPDPGRDYSTDVSQAQIYASIDMAGIKLQSINTPDDIAGWSIWRKMPNISAKYDNITFHQSEVIDCANPVYVDTKITEGEVYEYKFEFHHMNGSSSYTSNSAIAEARVADITAGSVQITNLQALPTNTSASPAAAAYSCQMKLEAVYDANDTEDLFAFISKSGAPDLFDSELETVKSSLKEMSHFRITKIDMTTGRQYNLGVHQAGIFIDNTGTTRTPLLPGSTYKYLIELCVSHPDEIFTRIPYTLARQTDKKMGRRKRSLSSAGSRQKRMSQARKKYSSLSSATRQYGSSARSGQSSPKMGVSTLGSNPSLENRTTSLFNPNYPEKFFSRFVTEDGTLSYGSALIDNHAESIYEIGATGVIAEADISVPLLFPDIDSGRVKIRKRRRRRRAFHAKDANGRTGRRSILIWSLSEGPRSLIDHFIVYANDQGSEYTIGAVHNIPTRGTYSFVDRSHADHVGPITYYVSPVYLDYTKGEKFLIGVAEY